MGDFNKDGKMDLAVANYNSLVTDEYYVVILHGEGVEVDGNLKFSAPVPHQVGNNPSSVTAGNINGDTNLDLVVTNSSSNSVSVLYNNGNLTVSSAVYAVGNNPVASVIGDLNGDGNVDIAVAVDNEVSILQGDGLGGFLAAVNVGAGCDNPKSLAIKDLDGDGRLDLVVGCNSSAQISILKNNRIGSEVSFQAAEHYAVQGFGSSVVIADFNSDDKLDVAAANSVTDGLNQASFLFGNKDGTFQGSVNYDISGSQPYSVVVLDFNGDGNLDLATANIDSNDVSIMYGRENGRFDVAIKYAVGSKPIGLVTGDFNLDGKLDLVVANSGANTITLLLNDGMGSFESKEFETNTLTGTKSRSLVVSDFNGDKNPDVVVANTGSNSLTIMLGDGKGKFQVKDHTNDDKVKSPRSVIAGDFNRDGKTDLAVASFDTKKVYILNGKGDGAFTPGNEYGGSSIPLSLAVGDFNRDGETDIAVAKARSGSLSILFGNGSSAFREEVISTFEDDSRSVAVGDFNGDGKLDIAVAVSFLNYISMFMGDGRGGFVLEKKYGTDNTPISVAVGDFNKDGKEDVATANQFGNNVTIIKSNLPKWKVQLNSETFSASESSGGITVSINREGNSTGVTSVVYSTSDGSAVAGRQYTATTGILEFQNGETSKSFTVPITNDNDFVGNKSFNVKISDPSTDAVIVKPSTAVLTIVEDDDESKPDPYTPGGGSSTTPTKLDHPIILDGVNLDKLASMKNEVVGGQSTTTMSLDNEKVIAMLEEKNRQILVIPVASDSDVVISELNVKLVKSLEKNDTVLEIRTNRAIYTIPSNQLMIDDIASQFGNNVKLEDIKISIRMGQASDENVKLVNAAANNQDVTLVVPPIEFEIIASYGDKKITISQFNQYVTREIVLPADIDPTKITTGVVLNSDGTFSHVPTKVFTKDGKPHALISSMSNSTYSIIWNPEKFADVEGHWSQNDVNDMASRLVVQGVTALSFQPDKDVNRAEFLAIVVRALGLKPGTGSDLPKDVKASDWYASVVQSAETYQLIQGYEDGTFRPSQTITREEAAVILSRAMTLMKLETKMTDDEVKSTLSSFADGTTVSDWSKKAIALLVKHGIMQGDRNNLSADDNLTRAQTAATVRRLLQQADLINK
ncbi:Endo-1,4-beta-xylanase A precursor [compost metagenome]